MARTEPANRPKGESLQPLRQGLPFLLAYKAQLCLALLFLTLASLSMLGMPVSIRYVIDYGFTEQRVGNIDQYFIALMLLALAFAIFGALRYYTVMWIGERVIADIRARVYEHVIRMSPTFFEVTRTGEVLSRLTTDTTLVQSVFGAGLSIALRSLFSVVGCLIMLFVTSPKLTAIILVLVPFVVFPVLLYGRKVRRLSRQNQDRIADSSGIADESLNAIHVVQAFTLERLFTDRFSRSVEETFAAARQRLRVGAMLSATIVLMAFAAIVFVLWIGAQSVIDGDMTAGTLGQFLLYATFLAGSTTALGEVWNDVQRAAGAMERLIELLNTKPEIQAPAAAMQLPVDGKGQVEFLNVSFAYPSRQQVRALDNFSLTIKPGETVALVGPSGAGKTTVFQLLLRFYDPASGQIKLDGVSITDTDPRHLRQCIAIVPQRTVLFANAARENIRFGRPDATDTEVIEAAKAASIHDFLQQQPEGYATELGEKGMLLSGGQQQRIAIARAIIKRPRILLLDEATSALDAESEQLVQAALEPLMREHTTLVIAHRLATVIKADRIVVMENGRVIDSGKHEQLLSRCALYQRLAKLQFGQKSTAMAEAVV